MARQFRVWLTDGTCRLLNTHSIASALLIAKAIWGDTRVKMVTESETK